jgi:hypothetical protein
LSPQERHRQERERVLGSLIATEDARACHHNSYARHPLARAVPQGSPSVAAIARSLVELGEMVVKADEFPSFNERLSELERLGGRLAEQTESLRRLVDREWMDALGVPPQTAAARRPAHGGHPDTGAAA